jgi:hypothetical protein
MGYSGNTISNKSGRYQNRFGYFGGIKCTDSNDEAETFNPNFHDTRNTQQQVSNRKVFLLLRFSKNFQTYAKSMTKDFELQDKIK